MRLLCLCLVLSFDSFSFRHFNCTDGKSYFLSNSKTNVRVDLRLTRNGWNLCRSCRRAEYVKNGSWLNDRKYTPAIFFPDRFFLNFSAVFYRRRSSWRTNGLKTGERPCLDKWRTTSHVLFKRRKKKSNWTMDRTGINPNEEKSDMSLRPTEQLTCQKEGSTQICVWTRAASSHFSVHFKSIETLFYYVSAFESKTTFSCCARNLNLLKYILS